MTRQAKLLYNHVLQIKLLNAAFDKVSHALQMFGQQYGELLVFDSYILDKCEPNATMRSRLGMSLYL